MACLARTICVVLTTLLLYFSRHNGIALLLASASVGFCCMSRIPRGGSGGRASDAGSARVLLTSVWLWLLSFVVERMSVEAEEPRQRTGLDGKVPTESLSFRLSQSDLTCPVRVHVYEFTTRAAAHPIRVLRFPYRPRYRAEH